MPGFCAVAEILLYVPFMFTVFLHPIHGQRRASRWPSKSFEMPTTRPELSKFSGNIQRRVNRPLFFKFLFDPNYQIMQKLCQMWASLRHPNILPLFGLVDHPAIPSTGIVTPHCTLGSLHCFFSDPTRASKVDRLVIVRVFSIP